MIICYGDIYIAAISPAWMFVVKSIVVSNFIKNSVILSQFETKHASEEVDQNCLLLFNCMLD